MNDHNVTAWQRHYDSQEAAAEAACRSTAAKNGLTPAQAGDCDDFSCGCLGCPFRSRPAPGGPREQRLTFDDLTFTEAMAYPDRGSEREQQEYLATVQRRRAGAAS